MEVTGLHLLMHLNWKLHRLYDRTFMEIRQRHQLTQNEIDVLLFLSNHKESNTAVDVVQYRAISKSLISKSVESLAKRGFLRTQADEKDRRCIRLYITPMAGHIMLILYQAQNRFFRVVKENLTSGELEGLEGIYVKLLDSIDPNL